MLKLFINNLDSEESANTNKSSVRFAGDGSTASITVNRTQKRYSSLHKIGGSTWTELSRKIGFPKGDSEDSDADSDDGDSSSSRTSSKDSSDLNRRVWRAGGTQQRILKRLRIARELIIQIYGSVDEAFTTFAVNGKLSNGLFKEMLPSMILSEWGDVMYQMLLSLCPVARDEANVSLSASLNKLENLARQDFLDAFKSVMPLSTLAQLRTRLRQVHSGLKPAWAAMKKLENGNVDAAAFRDLLSSSGVNASEAQVLFIQCMGYRETGCPAAQLTRRGLFRALSAAEGLAAARRFTDALQSSSEAESKVVGRTVAKKSPISRTFAKADTELFDSPRSNRQRSLTSDAVLPSGGFSGGSNRQRSLTHDGVLFPSGHLSGENSASRASLQGSRSMATGAMETSALSISASFSGGASNIVSENKAASPRMQQTRRTSSVPNLDLRNNVKSELARSTLKAIAKEPPEEKSLKSELDQCETLYKHFFETMGQKSATPDRLVSLAEFRGLAGSFEQRIGDLSQLFQLANAHGSHRLPLGVIILRALGGVGHIYDALRKRLNVIDLTPDDSMQGLEKSFLLKRGKEGKKAIGTLHRASRSLRKSQLQEQHPAAPPGMRMSGIIVCARLGTSRVRRQRERFFTKVLMTELINRNRFPGARHMSRHAAHILASSLRKHAWQSHSALDVSSGADGGVEDNEEDLYVDKVNGRPMFAERASEGLNITSIATESMHVQVVRLCRVHAQARTTHSTWELT
jgi:hypothetical protein